ncbi:uncharacterized protein CTRU02_200032 [Colletotrichum truncatum]|uniref:Uncharacterized protein n=1 Tax=Colletotrichum truncatum TaxID=5467 RepID=A0ACC3ZDG2_COLTU
MDVVPQGGTGPGAPRIGEGRRIQNMSEGSQQQRRASRNMRAERTTTSCGECRRRKQKCDQQQPCGNCQRRFPQPVCEYRIGNRIPGTSTFPAPARAGGRGLARDLSDLNSPLIEISRLQGTSRPANARWPGAAVTGSLSGFDANLTTTDLFQGSKLAWIADRSIGLTTPPSRLKLILGDSSCMLDLDPFQASQQVLTYRRAFPNLVLGAENDDKREEWTTDDDVIQIVWAHSAQTRPQRQIGDMEDQFGHLPIAQTPLNKKLLRIYFTILSRFKASLIGDPDPNNPFVKVYAPFCVQDPLVVQIIMYASACYLHETGHLPRTALMANKGRAIHMLNQRISFGQATTSGSSSENAGRGGGRTGDAAVASVIQLTAAEWYWGEAEEDVRHHFSGLRDMIRIRGGFDHLGMNGILAKNAICHDVSIALAHENSPLLLSQPHEGGGGPSQPWAADYAFADPIKDVPFRMSHCTPFVHKLTSVGTLPTFAECAQSLGVHRATASILDNVRFLFRAVEAAYATTEKTTTDPAGERTTRAPTKAASRKVQLTGKYIHEHILSLHPTIPGHRQSSPGVSTQGGNSPGSNYFAGTDEESIRSGSISSTGTAGPGSGGLGRSPPAAGSDSTTTPDTSNSPTSPRSIAAPYQQHQHQQSPDYMYQVIRAAAIVYSRAIMDRVPLSVACTNTEFLHIWTTTWRVPLLTWNGAVSIFQWIMLVIAPACHKTPHARFVKNMLMVSTLTLGVDNWAVTIDAARAAIKLQHWLKGEDTEEEEGEDEMGEGEGETERGGAGRRFPGREER